MPASRRTLAVTVGAGALTAILVFGATVVIRSALASATPAFAAHVGPAAAASPSSYAGLCPASAPTVTMQGRGVAATGVAYVGDATGVLVNSLDVTVESKGYSASIETPKAEAAAAAITAAFIRVGVAPGDIRTSHYTLGDPNAHVYVISQTIKARLSSPQQVQQVLPAIASVPDVSGWGTSEGDAADFMPTATAVRGGIATATELAKAEAKAVAAAAGIKLGAIYGVSTQPLTLCGGNPGWWLEEVTVTYPIR